MALSIYLETPTADQITVCQALRQQNDALRQELHDIRRVGLYIYLNTLHVRHLSTLYRYGYKTCFLFLFVQEMDEITDQFRTEDAEEFKQLQAELEIAGLFD